MDPDAQVILNAAFGLFPNAVGNPGNLSSPGEIFFVSFFVTLLLNTFQTLITAVTIRKFFH